MGREERGEETVTRWEVGGEQVRCDAGRRTKQMKEQSEFHPVREWNGMER